MPTAPSTPPPPPPDRAVPDGAHEHAQARQRLIQAALRLFAEVGFARASTRAICEAAGVNLSAIRYYFGDKFGLYRAAFHEPMAAEGATYRCLPDGASFSEATMQTFFRNFLAPLKQGEDMQRVMQLHFREMVEPTGVWQETVEREFKPEHEAFAAMLAREFGLPAPDTDVHRMVFALIGMPVHFFVAHAMIGQMHPAVVADAQAIDVLADRMAGYAMGMIEAERRRRETATGAPR